MQRVPSRIAIAMGAMLAFQAAIVSAKDSPKCEPPILAMTYNIRLDTPADGPNAWLYRKEFLISQIATLRPQILGMQEVLPNQRADLQRALPGYDFIGGGRDDGKLAGEASPLAVDTSAFKMLANGVFWLSPTPRVPSLGWDASFKRVATWGRLKRRSDGQRLLVINTHWDHLGQVARLESGKMITQWIAHNQAKGEHLVLMGDFNAEPSESSVSQLVAPATGLSDTRNVAKNGRSGPDFSFNAFQALPHNGSLIDHIFVGMDVEVRHHAVIAQHVNGRVASDHFPVVALIDISSQRDRPACGR